MAGHGLIFCDMLFGVEVKIGCLSPRMGADARTIIKDFF
jgi:hypothetical protein